MTACVPIRVGRILCDVSAFPNRVRQERFGNRKTELQPALLSCTLNPHGPVTGMCPKHISRRRVDRCCSLPKRQQIGSYLERRLWEATAWSWANRRPSGSNDLFADNFPVARNSGAI